MSGPDKPWLARPATGRVLLITPADHPIPKSLTDLTSNAAVTRTQISPNFADDQLLTLPAIRSDFEHAIWHAGLSTRWDKHHIVSGDMPCFSPDSHTLTAYSFKTAAERFRLIQSHTTSTMGAGQRSQGAAKRVRRKDEMTMKRPVGLPIGSSSAWADTFRPSLDAHHGLFVSRMTFLSCAPPPCPTASKLHLSGEFACFTRPEMKVERVSYDVITPSAARGILEAIYWKPQIRWVIDRIHVLKPIRFTNIRRNEVGAKAIAHDPILSFLPQDLPLRQFSSPSGQNPTGLPQVVKQC